MRDPYLYEGTDVLRNLLGINPDRQLFEDNAQYVRTSLVAYNAVFDDLGDKSKPEYLVQIVEDAISRGKNK